MVFQIGDKSFDSEKKILIMGILNITPDSFFDGGKTYDLESAVASARKMVDLGAEIIDVGGESTRPGAEEVSIDDELKRVLPVIKKISNELNTLISIDTYKSEVAEESLKFGAKIINDISGLTFDPNMIKVAAKYGADVIINHIKGTPKTMQIDPQYSNTIDEIKEFFKERVEYARSFNVNKIILDPGIGFGKKLEHNIEIIKRLDEFKNSGYPIMIGVSRKRFIGEILNLKPEERVFGTASAVAISVFNGADIIRVHDVKEMKESSAIALSVRNFCK